MPGARYPLAMSRVAVASSGAAASVLFATA